MKNLWHEVIQHFWGTIMTMKPRLLDQKCLFLIKLVLQVKIIALAGLAWMAESMMVNVLGVLGPEIYCRWRLSADAEASISIAGFLGLMLGCVVFGYIFDRFGRRFGMLLSVGWSAVFCLITAFSTRYIFLVINVSSWVSEQVPAVWLPFIPVNSSQVPLLYFV